MSTDVPETTRGPSELLGHPLSWLTITLVCVVIGYIWMSNSSTEVNVEPVKKLSPETVSNNLDQVGEILKQDSMAITDTTDKQRADEYFAIEQAENRLNPLFLAAEAHLLNNQYVLPEGDNAWNDYQQILEIDPDNIKAENGLVKIRNTLIDNAEIAIEVGNLEDAENWLVKLDIIQPGDPLQSELRADIKTQIELEAQARLRQQEEQQRLQSIENTLTQAKDEEALQPINHNKIKDLYYRVLELDPGNARATAGMERLVSSLLDESETRLRADDIEGATEYLGKAREMAPENKRLGSIQLALDTRLEQIEEAERRSAELESIEQFVDTVVIENQGISPDPEETAQTQSSATNQNAPVQTTGDGSVAEAPGSTTSPDSESETVGVLSTDSDDVPAITEEPDVQASGQDLAESATLAESPQIVQDSPTVSADSNEAAAQEATSLSDPEAAPAPESFPTETALQQEETPASVSTVEDEAVENAVKETAEAAPAPADEPLIVSSNANIIEEKSAEEIAAEAKQALLEKGVQAYYDGDYNASFELLYPLAEEGEARAQFRIGVMYRYGRSVSKNADLSEKWFTLALPTVLRKAQTGEAWAQTDLGTAYELGVSLAQDYERAAYWYRLAAEQNYPGAQTNLGVLYANGEGVDYNRSKAVFWLKKAANQGDLVALQNLSVMGENL